MKNVEITSPIVAQKNGVALIHQEPQSFSHLSVAENIFGTYGRKQFFKS